MVTVPETGRHCGSHEAAVTGRQHHGDWLVLLGTGSYLGQNLKLFPPLVKIDESG